MKKLISIVAVAMTVLCLTACAKSVKIDDQYATLGIAQVTSVASTSLYQDKTEVFETSKDAVEAIGYQYSFSSFYVFDTAEAMQAAQTAYAELLRGKGYADFEAATTSANAVYLKDANHSVGITCSEKALDWKGAEGKYILTVSIMYN